MKPRKYARLACLAAVETEYGVDKKPTAKANAIQLNDVTLTPLAGGEEERNLLLPYLGHQGVVLTGNHVQLEFSVEIAGSGEAGKAPGYGALLRGCGLSEVIDDKVKSVSYVPVSQDEESLTIHFFQDGVLHVALGVRGNVALNFTPARIPRFRFTFQGVLGTIADRAIPVGEHSGFTDPLAVSKTVTRLDLHGQQATIAESVALDLGVQVEQRLLIGWEGFPITDRKATGTAVVQAGKLSDFNWFDRAVKQVRAAMTLTHGGGGGNIVEVIAPKVQIGRPTQGQSQGIVNYSLPLMLTPDAGDDEITITVK